MSLVVVVCTCGKKLSVPEKLRGKRVECPSCSSPISVLGVEIRGDQKKNRDSAAEHFTSPRKIRVGCECGRSVTTGGELAGKMVKCPNCKQPLRIPLSSDVRVNVKTPIKTACACGKSLEVPRKYAGKSVRCPACKQPLAVPLPTADSQIFPGESDGHIESLGQRSLADDWSGVGLGLVSLFKEEGVVANKSGFSCPECRAEMGEEDVLCVQCGFHLTSGKQLKTKMYADHDISN